MRWTAAKGVGDAATSTAAVSEGKTGVVGIVKPGSTAIGLPLR
jgi:hypothetical protein